MSVRNVTARVLVLVVLIVIISGAEEQSNHETTIEYREAENEREDKVMKIVNKPPYNSGAYQFGGPQQQQYAAQHNTAQPSGSRGEVSETDVYLLSAIEKMAYRVDLMEKRLRRTEDLLHYVMVEQDKNKLPGDKSDPCPANFTRAAGGCYHVSSEEGGTVLDWQAASARCKALGGALAELATVEESQDLVSYIKSSPKRKDKSYWTGGLNPGLLWIWADSGRPVSATGGHKKPGKLEIRGSGRCLLLAYDAGPRSYNLAGADCAKKQHYLCEVEDNSLGRALDRIQRNLRLGGNATHHDTTQI